MHTDRARNFLKITYVLKQNINIFYRIVEDHLTFGIFCWMSHI